MFVSRTALKIFEHWVRFVASNLAVTHPSKTYFRLFVNRAPITGGTVGMVSEFLSAAIVHRENGMYTL